MSFTKETPPDLYIFMSWHFVRAYREAYIADDVWKELCEVASVADLKQHMDNPSKVHIPIHETVRKIFKLRVYEDHSPFWEPTPMFVGETLKDFLKFYFGTRPHLLDLAIAEKNAGITYDKKEVSSSTAEKLENVSEKDTKITDNKPDEHQDKPTPPALKGDIENKPVKKKPGRPKAKSKVTA